MGTTATGPRAISQLHWQERARAAVLELATTKEDLTSEDVWELLARRGSSEPTNPGAMGNVLKWATGRNATDGGPLLEATDQTRLALKSRARGRRARQLLWRSLVYGKKLPPLPRSVDLPPEPRTFFDLMAEQDTEAARAQKTGHRRETRSLQRTRAAALPASQGHGARQ